MKLGINQAYFLPYLGYFQLIHSVDKFILYELLSYRVQGWMHRNRIMDKSTGDPFFIYIPVANRSSNQLIRDTRLADNLSFRLNKILKSIRQNYQQAAHFSETFEWLENLFSRTREEQLNEFNGAIIRGVCDFVGITTEIQSHNEHFAELEARLEEEEYDELLVPSEFKGMPRKVKRAIRICREEGADGFVNLPGGRNLYDATVFNAFDIDLKFIAPPTVRYDQFGNGFIPNLSIIDLLMHCGKVRTMELISGYNLLTGKEAEL